MRSKDQKQTPHSIPVTVHHNEPSMLYLREEMVSAEGNGLKIEVFKNINGDSLLVAVRGTQSGEEAQYVLRMSDFVSAVATLFLSQQKTKREPAKSAT